MIVTIDLLIWFQCTYFVMEKSLKRIDRSTCEGSLDKSRSWSRSTRVYWRMEGIYFHGGSYKGYHPKSTFNVCQTLTMAYLPTAFEWKHLISFDILDQKVIKEVPWWVFGSFQFRGGYWFQMISENYRVLVHTAFRDDILRIWETKCGTSLSLCTCDTID